MKTYFTILATILALTITACNGFLEESPQSLLPEELAYNTKEDLLNNAVLMLYTHVGGNTDSEGLQGTGRGIYDLNTFTTDEAIMPTRGGDWYDGGFWQGLFLHKWGVNNDAILNTWEYLYRTIILCNRSLKHIEDFATIHTDMDVSAMKAEVKTLRAMFYYYAMDLFGNIPLITEYKDNGIDMKQEKRSAMFRFIVTELQESLPLLSNERCNWPGEYYGRMTQGVACFLLAKLALNAEIYMDDNWTDDQQPDGKQIMFKINGTEKMPGKRLFIIANNLRPWAIHWNRTILPISLYSMNRLQKTSSSFQWTRICIPISIFTCSAHATTTMPQPTGWEEKMVRVLQSKYWKLSATELQNRMSVLTTATLPVR